MNHRYHRISLRLTLQSKMPLAHGEYRLEFVEDERNRACIWLTKSERAAKLTWGSRVVLSALVPRGSDRTRLMLRSVQFEGRW